MNPLLELTYFWESIGSNYDFERGQHGQHQEECYFHFPPRSVGDHFAPAKKK